MDKKISFKRSLLGSAALLSMLTLSLVAAAKFSKTGTSTAGFHALGPAGLKIDGTTSELSVAEDGSTITITIPLTKIETGVSLRDNHTRKYLETDKFPNAELKVARSALKLPAAGAESSGSAKGSLKIHGQTKEVTVEYKAKLNGDTFAVSGSTKLNINDFGIETPGYLGVKVKPDVEVFANFSAKDN